MLTARLHHTLNASKEVPTPAHELRIKDEVASFDGTWQRRGFSSLNSVAGCITHGKVVDYAVLYKTCPSCNYWKSHQKTPAFEDWQRYYHSPINHSGSAGSMETLGVKQIFERSMAEKHLRYVKYLGAGD